MCHVLFHHSIGQLLDPHPNSLKCFYHTHFIDEEMRLREGHVALYQWAPIIGRARIQTQVCVTQDYAFPTMLYFVSNGSFCFTNHTFSIWNSIIPFVLFCTEQYHLLIVWKNRNKLKLF